MVRNCRLVEPVGGERDGACDRRIERVPHEVAQSTRRSRAGAAIAGRRHVDVLAGAEDHRAEHAPDRLGEAAGRVLRDRAGIGKSAVPGADRAATRARRSDG